VSSCPTLADPDPPCQLCSTAGEGRLRRATPAGGDALGDALGASDGEACVFPMTHVTCRASVKSCFSCTTGSTHVTLQWE